MATVIKTIGTNGRDYSTITAWEADLDNSAIYAAGDDAVGVCYNDSAFSGSIIIDGGQTIGLNSVTLTVAESDRHAGTPGTGAILHGNISGYVLRLNSKNSIVEWLEITAPGTPTEGMLDLPWPGHSESRTARHLLIYDNNRGASNRPQGIHHALGQCTVHNCMVFRLKYPFPASVPAVRVNYPSKLYNVTVYGFQHNGSSGDAYGITDGPQSTPDAQIHNCVVGGITSANGTASCFSIARATVDYSASEDATAPGSHSLHNITPANEFVSTVWGAEDLHLKSSAACIDAGMDLTSTGIPNIALDIDGQNRQAAWDIGADEYVSAQTFNPAWAMNVNSYIGLGR